MRCKPTLHYQLSDSARSHPAIAYPQAGSFVGYIADTFGTERVLRCFRELERGDDSTVVQDNRRKFEEIIGRPLKDVEQSWRAALQRGFPLYRVRRSARLTVWILTNAERRNPGGKK